MAPLLLLLLTVLWHGPPSAGFLQVEMAREMQTVLLNDNATLVCKVQSDRPLNITAMGVTWFGKYHMSKTELIVFQYFGGNQMISRSGAFVSLSRLESGDASLQLPKVQLSEAGEYRCEVVMTPNKAVGTVQLEVVVSSLFPEQAMVKEHEEQRILCNASGFSSITVAWKKWTQKNPQYVEVSEGVFTNHTTDKKVGMFNVTSCLILKPSLEDNMSIYQCVVWHKSSPPTSQSLNFTLTVIESEKTTHSLKCGLLCAGIIIIIIIIMFVLILCIFFRKWVLRQTNSLFFIFKASQNTQSDMNNYDEVLSL